MPRARNKEDLLQFSEENYAKLLKMISDMSENQMSTEFIFRMMQAKPKPTGDGIKMFVMF